jgi:shikimate dehydrogenase
MMQFGLIGYPLEHSLSPHIHNAALRAVGLPGDYRLYPILPLPSGAAGLGELVEQLREGRIQGLNVTIPHKQAVIPLLDELTPSAQAIGAVNTLFIRGARLIGDNTDAPGFQADLKKLLEKESPTGLKEHSIRGNVPQRALILGAGGSARAVAYALLEMGTQALYIAARRVEQAQGLARNLGGPSIDKPKPEIQALTWPFDAPPASLDLIVNCTPLGMHPNEATSPWPKGLPFPSDAVVYDLVYNPLETRFLRDARKVGLKTRNGMGMLIEQAALSFQRWTGGDAPRDVMWKALELKRKSERR